MLQASRRGDLDEHWSEVSGEIFGKEVALSWGSLDSLDSQRTVMWAWYGGTVTAALTASPKSPRLHSSEISRMMGQKRTYFLYLHLSGPF